MLYYLPWILLILISILLSIGAFLWAMKTGQFSDQTRARYLPLSDGLPDPPPVEETKTLIEVYVLLFIMGIGILSILSAVFLIVTQ